VFLRPAQWWNKKEMLLDGWRFGGIVTQFLPAIYFTCGVRTRPIERAEVDLRVLRDGPLEGVRILGRVATERSYADYVLVPNPRVSVEAVSANNRFVAVTDDKGVYDFKTLPVDDYKVRISQGEKVCDPFPSYDPVRRKSGDVGECNFTFPPASSPRREPTTTP
jgi:hypothetical protein